MGFGSYDESEQERQEVDTDNIDEDSKMTEEANHDGNFEFKMEDTDSALDRLDEMRDEADDGE